MLLPVARPSRSSTAGDLSRAPDLLLLVRRAIAAPAHWVAPPRTSAYASATWCATSTRRWSARTLGGAAVSL